ncbi:MAG: phage terminase large subunit [Elusimicrobia bacterium]|nr:phage terminase large subunit [Elusimicrobiota bacterium]
MNPEIKINRIEEKIAKERRKAGLDFNKFREYYFKDYNTIPGSAFHVELGNILQTASSKRGQRLAIAAPRGSAKSTIITLQYIIYSLCYAKERFVVIISNTKEQATTFLAQVKTQLESNPRLIADFPNVCEYKKPNPLKQTQREINTRNRIKIVALGSGQQLRGLRNNQYRPTLVVLDDVEGDEAKETETQDRIQQWFEKSILKAGDANTNFILTGTIHHYNSLLAKYTDTKEYSGWEKHIYKSIIQGAMHQELWDKWRGIYCNRSEYKGQHGPQAAKGFYEERKEIMLKGVKILWPEKFTYYDLMCMREDQGHFSFDCEMQNDPNTKGSGLFTMEDIRFWDEEKKENYAPEHSYSYTFAACDPSLGRSTSKGDYTAIIVGSHNTGLGVLRILKSYIVRCKPAEIVNIVKEIHREYHLSALLIETNNFQEILAQDIDRELYFDGCPLQIEKIQHTANKIDRIASLQVPISHGKILFNSKDKILLDQLRQFPNGKHDDGPDALETLYTHCFKIPQDDSWVRKFFN